MVTEKSGRRPYKSLAGRSGKLPRLARPHHNPYLAGRRATGVVAQLDPVEVAEKLRAAPQRILLLDVREPFERELAVIEPSVHIPMGEIAARLEEIPKDRDVVVYCHGGTRSMMVAGYLANHGWKSVANLAGGIDAWSVKVDPDVPRYS